MNALLSAWFAELALITYRDLRGGNPNYRHNARPPLPGEVASVMIVYGILGLAPPQAQGVAGAVGWGLVIATLLNLNWQSFSFQASPGGGEKVPTSPAPPSPAAQPGRSTLTPTQGGYTITGG